LKAATAALRAAVIRSEPKPAKRNDTPSNKTPSAASNPASAILETSSTQFLVTVDLDASSQREARIGSRVQVQLPSGTTVKGTIAAVSSVAQTSSSSAGGSAGSSSGGGSNSGGSSPTSTVPVTIRLEGHHLGVGLDQASVSVEFTQAEVKHGLSVPVTALIATAGGGFAVQEANAPHRLLPVTAGQFADGYVQISGAGIHPGLVVTISQG
jgi:hypothetical protein